MTETLAVRYFRGGGSAAVFVNNNGTFTQIGNTFTATETDSFTQDKANLAVQFLSPNDLYVWVADEIRQLNTGTSNWDVVHTATQGGDDRHTGLHVMYPNGIPTLVGIYTNTSNNTVVAVMSEDGTTWDEITSSLSENNQSIGGPKKTHSHGNLLFTSIGNDTAQLISFDTASKSFTNYRDWSIGGNATGGITLCTYHGRLYAHAPLASGGNQYSSISTLSAGRFIPILEGANGVFGGQTDAGGNTFATGWLLLFEAFDQLIAMAYQNRANLDAGLRVWRVLPDSDGGSTSATEVTNTVVPAAIRYPNGPFASGFEVRLDHIVDNNTNPQITSNITHEIWVSLDDGTGSSPPLDTCNRYQWNGASAAMGTLGMGGDWGIALTHTSGGVGEYAFNNAALAATGELHIIETAPRIPVSGGLQFTFTVDGDAGAGAVQTVIGLIDQPVGVPGGTFFETPESKIGSSPELSGEWRLGSATGGSAIVALDSNGDQADINNVTADGTTYTVIWDYSDITLGNVNTLQTYITLVVTTGNEATSPIAYGSYRVQDPIILTGGSFGGKYMSPTISGILSIAPADFLTATLHGNLAIAPIQYLSSTYAEGTIPAIEQLPRLRGPQVAANSVEEDRLANITNYQLGLQTTIDLTTVATTTVYTVPAGKTALITGLILEVTAADTITSDSEVSLGVNPSATNIFATEPLIGLNNVGKVYYYWANVNKAVAAFGGDQIDLDVSVAATATTLEVTARTLGILV